MSKGREKNGKMERYKVQFEKNTGCVSVIYSKIKNGNRRWWVTRYIWCGIYRIVMQRRERENKD